MTGGLDQERAGSGGTSRREACLRDGVGGLGDRAEAILEQRQTEQVLLHRSWAPRALYGLLTIGEG